MAKRKQTPPPAEPPPKKRLKKGDLIGRSKDDPIRVVSCKLNSIMRTAGVNPEHMKAFRQALKDAVAAFARLTHETTVFTNVLVDYCLRTDLCIPKIDQLFVQRCMAAVRDSQDPDAVAKIADPTIRSTVQHAWTPSSVDYISRCAGLSGFNAPLARELYTNIKNHLVENFYGRQKHVLKIQHAGAEDAELNQMQADINAVAYTGNNSTVLEHRAHIGDIGDLLNHRWLKQPSSQTTILKYYGYLGRVEATLSKSNSAYHELTGEKPDKFVRSKAFCYLPIRGYSLHCLPIEAHGLANLLVKAGMWSVSSAYSENQVRLYSQVFNLEKFATAKLRPGYRLSTDGCKASVEYFIKGGTHASPGATHSVRLSEEVRGLYAMSQVVPESDPDILGCDPGRHTLITLSDPETGGHFSYSKGEHYEQCGFRRATRIRNRWAEEATPEERRATELCASQSFKIGMRECLAEVWNERVLIEDTLWAFYGQYRWRNLRFETYGLKQRAYATLRNRIAAWAGRHPVIAMGAANFKVTSKGDVSGPLREMARKLSEEFRVVYTPEFRSSVCCHTCGCRMKNPPRRDKKDKDGKVVERGKGTVFCIFRCEQCRRFRNRDRNASRNIAETLLCHMEEQPLRHNFLRSTKKEHQIDRPQKPWSVSRTPGASLAGNILLV